MTWNTIKLKDCCEKIGSGATPKGGETVYISSGTALIRSQNVYNLHFNYDGLAYITDEAAQKLNGVTVCKNDILLNITGDSIARTCLVPENVLPARVNQHVSIIRPINSIILPQFLSYYLASPYMQKYMLGLSVGKGTSRNAMTKEMIEAYKIPVPPLNTQQKIVSILSAYDELIKANQKQICLLEEAARRLYREWFVALRFPGHENTPITDGIPAGWYQCKLSDAIDFNPSVSLKKGQIKQSVPMSALSTSSMVLNTKEFTDTYSNSGSHFQNADTLLARITPCLENGKTAFVMGLSCTDGAVGSTEFIVMRSKTLNPYMVYLLARTPSFRQTAISCMLGSDGRQRVNLHTLEIMNYLHPTHDLIQQFQNMAEPFFYQIYYLAKQCRLAAETRDFLLPKLMNREIEV